MLKLAVYPLTHVVGAPIASHSAWRPCAQALHVYPPWLKTTHARFWHPPKRARRWGSPPPVSRFGPRSGPGHPPGVRVHEARGAASWWGGSVGCQRSDPVSRILTITESRGVRPVHGVVRAARAARGADAGPQLFCLSNFGRVCAIRGALCEITGGAGPAKMAPAMPCVSALLLVYKPKRNYHVNLSDDTCYIQFRQNELLPGRTSPKLGCHATRIYCQNCSTEQRHNSTEPLT